VQRLRPSPAVLRLSLQLVRIPLRKRLRSVGTSAQRRPGASGLRDEHVFKRVIRLQEVVGLPVNLCLVPPTDQLNKPHPHRGSEPGWTRRPEAGRPRATRNPRRAENPGRGRHKHVHRPTGALRARRKRETPPSPRRTRRQLPRDRIKARPQTSNAATTERQHHPPGLEHKRRQPHKPLSPLHHQPTAKRKFKLQTRSRHKT